MKLRKGVFSGLAGLGLVLLAVAPVAPAFGVQAQTPVAVAPHFEAASIKPSAPDATGSMVGMQSPSAFHAENMTVSSLIAWAYQVRDFQVIDAPQWTKDLRFDIVGTTGFEPGQDSNSMQVIEKMRLMFQSLLADRFALKLRRETRQLPVYDLVEAAGGVKLQASHCVPSAPSKGCGNSGTSNSESGLTLTMTGVGMDRLATILSRITGRTVVDRTGYNGTFDASMKFAPLTPGSGDTPDPNSAPALGAPSLFSALQEQLGLKLKSAQGPVEVFVIEKIKKPTAN